MGMSMSKHIVIRARIIYVHMTVKGFMLYSPELAYLIDTYIISYQKVYITLLIIQNFKVMTNHFPSIKYVH